MKKLFLLAFFCLFTATFAQAQYKSYYVVEFKGEGYSPYWKFDIDFAKKLFYLDSDSPSEQNGRMKNYKENGNKKTFDVWTPAESGVDMKVCSVEFTADEGDKYTLVHKMVDGPTFTYILSTEDPKSSPYGEDGVNNPADKVKEKANSVKNAVSKGISKGLNALKKKK